MKEQQPKPPPKPIEKPFTNLPTVRIPESQKHHPTKSGKK